MKKLIFPLLTALPLLLASCATPPPPPPQVYRGADAPALVIYSLDQENSRMVVPTPTKDAANAETISLAKRVSKQSLAIVILDNYHETYPGNEFRDRGVPWFVNLRNLGYERIVFLHGNGVPNPNGLDVLAKYD